MDSIEVDENTHWTIRQPSNNHRFMIDFSLNYRWIIIEFNELFNYHWIIIEWSARLLVRLSAAPGPTAEPLTPAKKTNKQTNEFNERRKSWKAAKRENRETLIHRLSQKKRKFETRQITTLTSLANLSTQVSIFVRVSDSLKNSELCTACWLAEKNLKVSD